MKTKSTLKHILKLLCCFCLLICSVFMFTACNDAPGAQPSKPTSGSESGDGGGDDIELDENGNLPEDAGLNTGKFSDYFSGYTVLTNADGSLMLFDPTKNPLLDRMTSFSTLVDRQIDVLAQDILYRLASVYVKTSHLNESDNIFRNLKYDGQDYAYNGANAGISKFNILSKVDDSFNCATEMLTQVDLADENVLETFQKAIIITNETNIIKSQKYLDISGAIDGHNTKYEADAILGTKSLAQNVNNRWKIVDSITKTNPTDNVSLSYLLQVKPALKTKIAQIILNDTTLSYDQMIQKINFIGIFNSYKTEIVDYIKDEIIGANLISRDAEYFEIIKNGYSSVINGAFINAVTANAAYTNDYSPMFYKGYNIIVPAIVDNAFANTFAGTTTSIYPKFARVNSTDIDFSIFDAIQDQDVDWNLGPMSVNKIVLKPQEGKKLEGFELKIDTGRVIKEGASASIPLTNTEYYADDVVVELKVNVEYVANGIPLVSTSKTIKCDADTDNDGVIKLDSAGEVYTLPNSSNPTERIEYFREFHEVTFDLFPENSDKNAEDQYITENDTTITPFGVYNDGSNGTALSLRDMFTNVFKGDNGVLTYDAGNNYVQITFEIVSVKRCTNHSNGQKVDAGIHDENCQYVDFFDYEDIVFDFSISPYDVN